MRTNRKYPALIMSAMMVFLAGTAALAANPAKLCEDVAEQVSHETGVPVSVLKAISLNETGRKSDGAIRPWPWTVNMEGAGHWFDERDEALRYVFQEYKRGARSFDIGCFQINYKWHGDKFRSIEEMFDPLANARYAARFLTELHQETGDWSKAAGAYHSRSPQHATRYAARFERFRAKLTAQDRAHSPAAVQAKTGLPETNQPYSSIPEIPDIVSAQTSQSLPEPRENGYPLLKGGGRPTSLGAASNASLFAAAIAKQGES